jgi:hypothetical protein
METRASAGARGGILNKIAGLWRTPPLRSAAELKEFLAAQAAFVAQKSSNDYCRSKAGSFSHALFTEQAFIEALTRCRWESFAAVLADVLIVTEGLFRRRLVDPALAAAAGRALAAFYPAILAGHPLPTHRPEGWADAEAEFARRRAAALAAEPAAVVDVATHSARRVFDTLPIHSNMRIHDEEVVFGSVRFLMVSFFQKLEQRLAVEEVAHDLAATA